MYKIERQKYGYKLTFSGVIREPEMTTWVEESRHALLNAQPGFGVFVDMRDLATLPHESQEMMEKGQKLYKEKGMARSVVIVTKPITRMQFMRIGKETGIYDWERYLSASDTPDWERVGLDWIEKGFDPD